MVNSLASMRRISMSTLLWPLFLVHLVKSDMQKRGRERCIPHVAMEKLVSSVKVKEKLYIESKMIR
jgi:hypothetical protein